VVLLLAGLAVGGRGAGASATVPAPGDQALPAVAFDGTNYLVVWEDTRSGARDIYGIRVNPAGEVIDSGAIPISAATGDQRQPAIAFDGANYLVVWQDARSGTRIYGARVTPAGVVLDPLGIPIAAGPGGLGRFKPRLAFGGGKYLVAWEDTAHDLLGDIYGGRVTPAGVVLDPDGVPILTTWQRHFSPHVAFDGTNYLVACDAFGGDHLEALVVPVLASGQALSAIRVAPNRSAGTPALAFGAAK
jgi:large repetitive protein